MIKLELVKRTDPRYQEMRDRHYIPNRGTHGQQCHYLIWDDNSLVGIVSGAAAVYGVAERDRFFGLPRGLEKEVMLNGIVHNVVFRIEQTRSNLATQVLAKWRRLIAHDWHALYGVRVAGFETLVIPEVRDSTMSDRLGTLYLADNWTACGQTAGNTKAHGKGGLTTAHARRKTDRKLLFCFRCKNVDFPTTYVSTWNSNNPEAKAIRKMRQEVKLKLLRRGPVMVRRLPGKAEII